MLEPTAPTVERVTKLDAIRRQLRAAIQLFFEQRDNVPTYTLAAAVQELLRDLLRPRGQGSFSKDSDWIRPERRKDFLELMNRPQNFFKHADRDPGAVLEFNPKTLEYVLLDCALMYQAYTGRGLREGWVFFVWFSSTYPDLLVSGPFKDALLTAYEKLGAPLDKRLVRELLDQTKFWSDFASNFD